MEGYQATEGGAYAVPTAMNNGTSQLFDYAAGDAPMGFGGGYAFDGVDFDPDAAGGYEDSNDPKRRRIARACDMCRKKKIKCDGKMPACSHCENYKTVCIFTQIEKKRNPPKGAKYIEGLENRLGRMESLLRISGLLGEEDDKTDLGTLEKRLVDQAASQNTIDPEDSPTQTSPIQSTAHDRTRSETLGDAPKSSRESLSAQKSPQDTKPPAPEKKNDLDVEALSDMMCSLVTNNVGESRYIGSSSGFSIFSPQGFQWVNEKTGDDSFQRGLAAASAKDGDSKWEEWNPEIFGDIFARRIFRPLPPLNEALSLLKDFFENWNCMFPLFHEPTFMHLVRRQYSRDPYDGSGWWASLNCALAIAHRLRVMSNLVPQEEDQKAWGYMKNALGVLTELTMKNTDLLSVQALLGMALFLLGTANPQPSFLLVAAALRLAHSIGLHKRGTSFNLSAVEIEQRKRVFWIAYALDKDMSLRSGRPFAQDDDDMNVELPSEDPGDNIGNIPLADGKGKINFFRTMCEFSLISARVYKRLYSTKASKSSDGELLNAIGELDKELEDWKDKIPIDFRPEHDIKTSHAPLIMHIVMLHFSYYNCLTTIHRMSVHHGYWTSRLSNYAIQGLNARPLNPRVFSSANICVAAARSTIQLLKSLPQGDSACAWMTVYFPVSALMTLFTNVLQNPQDARARSDMRLMRQAVSYFSNISGDGDASAFRRMLNVCIEFERIAQLVIDRSDKDAQSKRKRKNKDNDDTTMQDAPSEHKKSVPSISTSMHQRSPSPVSVTTATTTTASDPVIVTSAQSMSNLSSSPLPRKGQHDDEDVGQASLGSALQPDIASTSTPNLNSLSASSYASPNPTSTFYTSTPISATTPAAGEPPLNVLPSYVPQPGDFPNMFTEFAEAAAHIVPHSTSAAMGNTSAAHLLQQSARLGTNNAGATGPVSGPLGSAAASGTGLPASGFDPMNPFQASMGNTVSATGAPDLWHMPMGLDWDWTTAGAPTAPAEGSMSLDAAAAGGVPNSTATHTQYAFDRQPQ